MRRWRECTLSLVNDKLARYEDNMEQFTWDDLDDLWAVLDGTLEDNYPTIMQVYIERLHNLRFSDKALVPGVHFERKK